jgi:transposase-like protein
MKEVVQGRGTATEVAERYGVTRQSLHNWLRRCPERGMAGRHDPQLHRHDPDLLPRGRGPQE